MSADFRDVGDFVTVNDACSSENSGAPSLITAAGTGDATKVTGQTVDRKVGTAKARSCVVSTAYLAALTAAKTISLAHEVQYSDDGSTWDTAVVIEASAVKATGAGNKRGVDEHKINLESQKRYFRINVTPDLSHTSTDTATFHTTVVLGGFSQVPQ